MASHYGGARYPAGELEGLTDGSYCGTLARVRVVSDAKYGYNNCIETRCEIVLKKIQFTSCPLLPLLLANYQNILKNTCKNEPGKRLNKPVPERQGRNEYRPIEGIDTNVLSYYVMFPCTIVEMSIARLRALTQL